MKRREMKQSFLFIRVQNGTDYLVAIAPRNDAFYI